MSMRIRAARTACAVLTVLALSLTALHAATGREEAVTLFAIDYPRATDPNYSDPRWTWGHPAMTFQFGWGKEDSSASKIWYEAFSIIGYEGQTVYCLEPGVPPGTGIEPDPGYFDNYPLEKNTYITRQERKNLLSALLFHGYRGNVSLSWSTAANSEVMAFHAATQYLIHEVVVGERDGSFNHIDPPAGYNSVLDQLTGANIPIASKVLDYYRQIEKEVKASLAVPSFMSPGPAYPVYQPVWNGTVYTLTLTDTNDSLAGLDFSSDVPGVAFSVAGTQLTVTCPTRFSVADVSAVRTFDAVELLVYADSFSEDRLQDLLSFGATTKGQLRFGMRLHVEGSVGIRKLGNYTSGSHPTGSATGVITEVDYAPGAVPGAVYELRAAQDITDVLGAVIPEGTVVDTITTVGGNPGYAFSAAVPAGNYVLVETKAPEGYRINLEPIPVALWPDEGGEGELTLDVRDDPQRFSFGLLKSFETLHGAPPDFSDVEFSLYAAADILPSDPNAPAGAVVFKKDQLIEIISLSGSGEGAVLSALPEGGYYLEETKSPELYRPVGRTDFSVSFKGLDPHTEIFEVSLGEFVNTQKTASLELSKFLEGSDTAPAGVQFLLTFPDASTMILVTDASGKAGAENLPLGTYTLEELRTPENEPYVLMELVTFDLAEDMGFYSLEIHNALIRGSVRLVKKSEQSGKTLAGAVFELRDPGGELLATLTTDKDGVIEVGELPYGKGYSFKETVAPAGFALLSKPILFDVTENLQTIELTALNKTDVVTGDGSQAALWFAVLAVSLCGAVTCAVSAAGRRRAVRRA